MLENMANNTTDQPGVQPVVDRETAKNLRSLRNMVNLSQGKFSFALAEYDLPRQWSRVPDYLQHALPDLNQIIVTLAPLPSDEVVGVTVLDMLAKQVQAESPNKSPDFLVILGLETLLGSASDTLEEANRKQIAAIQPFNLGRNILAQTYPCPVLLVMPMWAMRIFVSIAPDVNSWRSGFYTFRSNLPQVAAELQKAATEEDTGPQALSVLRRQTEEGLEEQANRQTVLIRDAETALRDPSLCQELAVTPTLLAQLYRRQGWLYLALGYLNRAQEAFQAMQQHAQAVQDPSLISAAKQGLAKIEELAAKKSPVHTAPQTDEANLELLKSLPGAAMITSREHLFGREMEWEALTKRFTSVSVRFLILWGEEGCGKSSLVRAGLMPNLSQEEYLIVYVKDWDFDTEKPKTDVEWVKTALKETLQEIHPEVLVALEPDATLVATFRYVATQTKKTVVLVCDQFDRFFWGRTQRSERLPLLRALGACYRSTVPCKLLFIIRDKRLGSLAEFAELGRDSVEEPLAQAKRFYLPSLDTIDARHFLRDFLQPRDFLGPDIGQEEGSAAPGGTESAAPRVANDPQVKESPDRLVSLIVDDLKNEERIRPLDLQLVKATLILTDIRTPLEYARFGGANILRDSYVLLVLERLSQTRRRPLLPDMLDRSRRLERYRRLLAALISTGLKTRILLLTAAEIATQARLSMNQVQDMLPLLEDVHIIQRVEAENIDVTTTAASSAPRYMLISDLLVEAVSLLQDQRRMADYRLHRALRSNRHLLSLFDLNHIRRYAGRDELRSPQARVLVRNSRLLYNTMWYVGLPGLFVMLRMVSLIYLSYVAIEPVTNRVLIFSGIPIYQPFQRKSDNLDTGYQISDFQNPAQTLQWWTTWHNFSQGQEMADPKFQRALKAVPGVRWKLQLDSTADASTLLLPYVGDPQYNSIIVEAISVRRELSRKIYEEVKRQILNKDYPNASDAKKGSLAELLTTLGKADNSLAKSAYSEVVLKTNSTDRPALLYALAPVNEQAADECVRSLIENFNQYVHSLRRNPRNVTSSDPLPALASLVDSRPNILSRVWNVRDQLSLAYYLKHRQSDYNTYILGIVIAHLPDSYRAEMENELYKMLQDKNSVQNAIHILGSIAVSNSQLAISIFYQLIDFYQTTGVLSTDNYANVVSSLCDILPQMVQAEPKLADPAINILDNIPVQRKDSKNNARDMIVTAWGEIGKNNPSTAAKALQKVRNALPTSSPKVTYLAMAYLLGSLSPPDHVLAAGVLEKLKQWHQENLQNSQSDFDNYPALCSLARTEDDALRLALDWGSKSDGEILPDPISLLGEVVAVRAARQADPVAYLMDNLQGHQPLLPNLNLTVVNSAFYRRIIERAIEYRMTSKEPFLKANAAEVTKLNGGLNRMLQPDQLPYHRIAAWNILAEAFRETHLLSSSPFDTGGSF